MLKQPEVTAQWKRKQVQLGEMYFMMINERSITLGDKTMNFQYFTKGEKPLGGYTLIFGFHGGGGCPTPVNDQQFQNHLNLYDQQLPSGTIWFVPRSCQEASDMWWKPYLPEFFSIIIQGFVLKEIVNPNKIFMTGYSAGGDGIYHLGPMVADWLAGAAMMAGHPNGVQIFNVRNIAFSIQVGGMDHSYNRNNEAKKYIAEMNTLKQRFGGFATQYCNVFQQCQHWMDRKDAKIFHNFFKETRNPYPDFITFKQHPRIRKQFFYYIEVIPENHKELMIIKRKGNSFFIESQVMPVTIWINHLFINYFQQVKVWHNGTLTACKKPEKNLESIKRTIQTRLDPQYIFQDCLVSVPTNGRVPLETTLKQQVELPKAPQINPPQTSQHLVQQQGRIPKQSSLCCKLI